MRNRGFTLIEILVITGLVMVIVTAVVRIGFKGQHLVDETTKTINLQTGVRSALENMIQDVNASITFLNASNQKMILARFKGEVTNDVYVLNSQNPVFPYYVEGQQTTVKQPALFVEYEFFGEDMATSEGGSVGEIKRKTKEGVLLASDSPQNAPYYIDQYDLSNLVEVGNRRLAEKVTYFHLDYYGYDPVTGQLSSIGELGGGDGLQWNVAMVAVHIVAEDPYERENRITPQVEIYTKIWSYKAIYDNKYAEYFGHLDRDLRF